MTYPVRDTAAPAGSRRAARKTQIFPPAVLRAPTFACSYFWREEASAGAARRRHAAQLVAGELEIWAAGLLGSCPGTSSS